MHKKSQQLGMSFSTANYRLQRQILFSLTQELGRDVCFQCAKKILTVEEFSVEHKKPWLDVSVELFWDLENIAFSHLRCNSKARRVTEASKGFGRNNGPFHLTENAPEGKAWCGGHRDYVVVENFHSNKRNASGYASYCKECRQHGFVTGVDL